MQKAHYKILSASMFAAACLGCHRQLYSIHVVGHLPDGIRYEHEWEFVVASHTYGLEQYSYWEDSHGVRFTDYGHTKERGGIKRTYTIVQLGLRSFTIRAHAWMLAAAVIASLVLALYFIVGAISGEKGGKLAPNDDPV
jgi:hypothetical protein